MKANEIREMSNEELVKQINVLKDEFSICVFSRQPASWKTLLV